MNEQELGFDESIEIADEAFSTDFEKENAKKYKSIYKKGGHNRTNSKNGK